MNDEFRTKNTPPEKFNSKMEGKVHSNMDIDILNGVGDNMDGDIDVDADEYPDTYADGVGKDQLKNKKSTLQKKL